MTRAPFLVAGGFVALLPLTAIAADVVVVAVAPRAVPFP